MNSSPTTTSNRSPGWYPDPSGRGKRYWDGHSWTSMKCSSERRLTGGGAWVRLSGNSASPGGY